MRHWLLAIVTVLTSAASGSDWNQWFGPNHDGSSDEKMPAPWPAGGPKVLWKVPMPEGLGTPAAAGGKVYLMGLTEGRPAGATGKRGSEKGGSESIICLDANTGKQAWAQSAGA